VTHNKFVNEPQPEAVDAIRAWYRLQRATQALGAHIRSQLGLTGEQLALLRIIGERDAWPLAQLRSRLDMHPATLGQSLARLEERGLVDVSVDTSDRRRRTIALRAEGLAVLSQAPHAGPGTLRAQRHEPERLRRLADAFDDAVVLFGLEECAS